MVLLSEFQASQVEFWRVVGEFPGYDVSSFGRLRNSKGLVLVNRRDRYGYIGARLSVKGKEHHRGLHRLVAGAFIENQEGLPEVNHLTGLKTDNRDGNLEWATPEGNREHAARNGLRRSRKNGHRLQRGGTVGWEELVEETGGFDRTVLEALMGSLSARERETLRLRHGLTDGEPALFWADVAARIVNTETGQPGIHKTTAKDVGTRAIVKLRKLVGDRLEDRSNQ